MKKLILFLIFSSIVVLPQTNKIVRVNDLDSLYDEIERLDTSKQDYNSNLDDLSFTMSADILNFLSANTTEEGINILLPDQTTSADKILGTDGSNPIWMAKNNYAVDTSSTDSYKIVLANVSSLVEGLEVTVKVRTTNTTAASLTINALSPKAIYRATVLGLGDIASGDIQASQIIKLVYDGTQFQIISRLAQ